MLVQFVRRTKYRKSINFVYHRSVRESLSESLSLTIDRASKVTLAQQIYRDIAAAIVNGVLVPGARLPSWRDLAAQLGVARGTVRAAYERLIDAQLAVSSIPGGTHVERRLVSSEKAEPLHEDCPVFEELFPPFSYSPTPIFQGGVPAQECFPSKLVARLRARAVRVESSASARYPDPRGERELRREIAAHLAIVRGVECAPSQVFVTSGFSGALGLSLQVLGLEGRSAWIENPGFPLARRGLEIARIKTVAIPVDAHGLNVEHGLDVAPDAALVVITPSQQAPLGPPLSPARRAKLLRWAARAGSWIVEDDYLSELCLRGRPAPALASLDELGCVIHLGSFSKTISPTLRLGFVVVPPALAIRFAEATACLSPAPGPSVQLATAEFMRDGHYLRHLRKMRRIYSHRRDQLMGFFESRGHEVVSAGLAVMLRLPNHVSDTSVAKEARTVGLAPSPLSAWYTSPDSQRNGLLLNVAAVSESEVHHSCEKLCAIVARLSS